MAAPTTSAASVYSVRTVAYPGGSFGTPGKGTSSGECSVESPLPRSSDGSLKTAEANRVDIIGAMSLQDVSDEGLITRYRAEENRAESQQYVNELFSRHYVKIARWCLAFTGDRESASDLAQEICAKAYQHLSSFKGHSRFSTWLFSIARNHCFNAVRSRASVPTMDLDETVIESLPDLASEAPDAALERKQLSEIARQLLNEALEETERVVFTLHFAEGLPVDVITRMLNLDNASGAKAFLVSARRKLERAVKRQGKARA